MTFKPNINKRFQRLQDDLTKEEFDELKESIKREKGNRLAILLMQGDTIVDGHHRYKACVAVKVEPKYEHRVFDGKTLAEQEAAAEEWALREQLGRRNLTKEKFRLQIGRLYNNQKEQHGGDRKSSPQNEDLIRDAGRVSEKVASETGVSKATVERAGKRAAAYDKLTDSAKKAATNKKLSDDQVIALSKKNPAEQNIIARDLRVGERTVAQVFPNGKPKKKPSKPPKQPPKSKAKDDKEARRRAAVGYFEYGMRALDDLQDVVPNGKHADCIKKCQAILLALKGWK